jgi:hypothetical protein
VNGRWALEHLLQAGEVSFCDGRGVEVVSKTFLEKLGTEEGPFHGELLIEEHTDEHCEIVGGEKSVGVL